MENFKFRIRPHHGMCMLFFKGKGYSSEFTSHMSATITALEADPFVRLTVGTDEICRRCPNNVDGACTTAEKTAAYDARVLALCGFAKGAVIPYSRFRGAVLERIIIPGKRADVCGDCEWNEVCSKAEQETVQLCDSRDGQSERSASCGNKLSAAAQLVF